MKPALWLVAVMLTLASTVQGQRPGPPGSDKSQFTANSRGDSPRGDPSPSPRDSLGGFRNHRTFVGPAISTPDVPSRRFNAPTWRGGRDFDRDGHHHPHPHFIFINSCWFWWDAGFGGWCYWPGPPPSPEVYADDGGWQFAPDATIYRSSADYERGRMWAQDLRREVVTWDQFVAYVKTNVLNTVPDVFSEFRRGFIVGYGENAGAAFDKAILQAAPPPPDPAKD